MFQLDLKSGKPFYIQIVNEYKSMLYRGYLNSGDSIPSVRKLALSLSVTPGTVAKAYQELERQGIIETVRGKGTFISEFDKKGIVDEGELIRIKREISTQCLQLIFMGFKKKEYIQMMDQIYEDVVNKEEKKYD